MIDFPTAPVVGTVVTTPEGISWEWDGATWNLITSGAASPAAPGVRIVTARLPALLTWAANTSGEIDFPFPALEPGEQAVITSSIKLLAGSNSNGDYFVIQQRATNLTDMVLVHDLMHGKSSLHCGGMLWIEADKVGIPIVYRINVNNNPSETQQISVCDETFITCTYFPA